MIAWLFNLDADVELAATQAGKGYTPSRAVLAAMVEPARHLAASLARAGDAVIVEDAAGAANLNSGNDPESGGGPRRGRAFCPTARALALFRRLGIEPEPSPAMEVLRRVNSRAFCAELGQNLPGAVFATTVERAVEVVRDAPPIGKQWRAKRAFGMSGRGQRPIAPGNVSALGDADRDFLRTSIARDGGIQIEPEVDVVRELAIHGMLGAAGEVALGRVVVQRCDGSGQWLASRALDRDDGGEALEAPLRAEATHVAHALHAAGYFGPFGIDAYEYRERERPDLDSIRLNPRSEINARYSMGFAASGLL